MKFIQLRWYRLILCWFTDYLVYCKIFVFILHLKNIAKCTFLWLIIHDVHSNLTILKIIKLMQNCTVFWVYHKPTVQGRYHGSSIIEQIQSTQADLLCIKSMKVFLLLLSWSIYIYLTNAKRISQLWNWWAKSSLTFCTSFCCINKGPIDAVQSTRSKDLPIHSMFNMSFVCLHNRILTCGLMTSNVSPSGVTMRLELGLIPCSLKVITSFSPMARYCIQHLTLWKILLKFLLQDGDRQIKTSTSTKQILIILSILIISISYTRCLRTVT